MTEQHDEAVEQLAAVLAKAVDDTDDLYAGDWSDDYLNEWEDGARAVIAAGWLPPESRASVEAERAERREWQRNAMELDKAAARERDRADRLDADMKRHVEYVRDRFPDHDQYVHEFTDWLTALCDRAEEAERQRDRYNQAAAHNKQLADEWQEKAMQAVADLDKMTLARDRFKTAVERVVDLTESVGRKHEDGAMVFVYNLRAALRGTDRADD